MHTWTQLTATERNGTERYGNAKKYRLLLLSFVAMFRRMSSSLRFLSNKFGRSRDCNVIVLGLDNAGKSTVINFLRASRNGEVPEETVPTIGFRMETFTQKNVSFTAYDMSGQGKYRNLWEKHFKEDVHAVIFVIDSTDKMRMCVAKDELNRILGKSSQRVPVLFLANKEDRPDSMSTPECISQLGLEKITDRAWMIVSTNARKGDGLEEAIDWLAESIDA